MSEVYIRFDGPPGPVSGRFIEVERDGASISFGEWRDDGDDCLLVLTEYNQLEERNRKLEAENLWMRREIERVGHAIYTGDKGYVGTEEDLQAIGQSVEGICETLDRMIEPEAENEKLQEAQITRQLGRIRRGEDLTTPAK